MHPLPKAAMFALAYEGHGSLFEQVVACILSIRTRNEVSLVAAWRVFAAAPTAAAVAGLDLTTLDHVKHQTGWSQEGGVGIRRNHEVTKDERG